MSIDFSSQLSALKGIAERPGTTPDQVRALAEQFESLLLNQMLRDMRESMLSDDDSSGSAPLGDSIFSELSLALSRAGGVGLTQALSQTIQRQAGVEDAIDPAAVTNIPANLPPAALPIAGRVPDFELPEGRVSSAFGWRRDPIDGTDKFHKGIDVALPTGSPVPAARAGVVTFAGTMTGYGTTVIVQHENGIETRYAHLSEALVAAGDRVAQGAPIGRSGATGRATGPHLHFEVLAGGQAVDPGTLALTPPAGD